MIDVTLMASRFVLPGTLVLLLTACGGGNKAATPAGVPVVTAPAEIRKVPLSLEAVGTVEPQASVAVRSQVDGPIVEVLVSDGQDVAQDTPLFRIDPRPYQIQLQQAEAALARDQALLATATAQEKRYRELLAQKYISPDGYAQVKNARDTAAAAVATDRGAVENAKLLLDYTLIRAPIGGRLGRIALQRGNQVRAADTTPLVVLNRVDPVYIDFSVPERTLPAVRAALAGTEPPQVAARIPQSDAAPVLGALSFIDNAVDAATGTLRLRGTFANADHQLWPGQFVNVSLRLGEQADALVIPAQAVQTGPKGTYVFVIGEGGTASLRDVEVARSWNDLAVIAKGLQAGEPVVIDGQSRLTAGSKVAVQAPAAAAAATAAQK